MVALKLTKIQKKHFWPIFSKEWVKKSLTKDASDGKKKFLIFLKNMLEIVCLCLRRCFDIYYTPTIHFRTIYVIFWHTPQNPGNSWKFSRVCSSLVLATKTCVRLGGKKSASFPVNRSDYGLFHASFECKQCSWAYCLDIVHTFGIIF